MEMGARGAWAFEDVVGGAVEEGATKVSDVSCGASQLYWLLVMVGAAPISFRIP